MSAHLLKTVVMCDKVNSTTIRKSVMTTTKHYPDNLQTLFETLRESAGKQLTISEDGESATGIPTSFVYVSSKNPTLTIILQDDDDIILDLKPGTNQFFITEVKELPAEEAEAEAETSAHKITADLAGLTAALYEKSHEPSFETLQEAETFATHILNAYVDDQILETDFDGLVNELLQKENTTLTEATPTQVSKAKQYAQELVTSYLPTGLPVQTAPQYDDVQLNIAAQAFYEAANITLTKMTDKPRIVAGLKAALQSLNTGDNV